MGASVDHRLTEKNLETLGKEGGWGKWLELSGSCRSGIRAEGRGALGLESVVKGLQGMKVRTSW